MSNEEDPARPLLAHVYELRQTFIHCLITIAIAVAICFYFYQDIFHILTQPLMQQQTTTQSLIRQEIKRERFFNPSSTEIVFSLPLNSALATEIAQGIRSLDNKKYLIPPGGSIEIDTPAPTQNLVLFGPIEGMTLSLKVCFWLGLILSSPIWLWLIFRFFAPGLRKQERQLAVPFLGLAALFLAGGIALAYFITIPLANQYLWTFNADIGTNLWSLSQYIHYSFFLMLANGGAFELGLVLFVLVHLGILGAEAMAAKRRHMILIAFILGALLTPPDVLTQVMLAVPLILLYELAIIYAKVLKCSCINDAEPNVWPQNQ